MNKYVHGYSEKEALRLEDQANTLTDLLHHDSIWNKGEMVLEAGCGVGAQTKIIAPKNPHSKFISVDISEDSLSKAKSLIQIMGLKNVCFQQADIYKLPFDNEYFDHIFVCFVLEHLHDYRLALKELKRVLKINGTISVIEGDHGSAFFYPDSEDAHAVIRCQIELQYQQGGDANIGRKIYPMLANAGFSQIKVTPRVVYVDNSKPHLIEGFTKNTFTAMIEGIRDISIKQGIIDPDRFEKGIAALYRTAEKDGVFYYTFFKGIGVKMD
jgi:ubiquinone/menaquinone biosynthesis C-methylase UbiE